MFQLYYSQEPVGDGSTNDYAGLPFRVRLGIGDIKAERKAAGYIPDLTLFKLLVASEHEQAHISQAVNFQRSSNNSLGRLLAIKHVATQYNFSYYVMNYRDDIREITAEYEGVVRAREDLVEMLSKGALSKSDFRSVEDIESFADDVALLYVNERAHPSRKYFVKYPTGFGFQTMGDVEKAFFDAFDGALIAKRNYVHAARDNKNFRSDTFSLLTGLCDKPVDDNPWRSIGQKILDADSGQQQDYMMACLMQYVHYNDIGFAFSAFPDNNAKSKRAKYESFEKAFGCRPPEGPVEANARFNAAKNAYDAKESSWLHPIKQLKLVRANAIEYQNTHRHVYFDTSDLELSVDMTQNIGPEM